MSEEQKTDSQRARDHEIKGTSWPEYDRRAYNTLDAELRANGNRISKLEVRQELNERHSAAEQSRIAQRVETVHDEVVSILRGLRTDFTRHVEREDNDRKRLMTIGITTLLSVIGGIGAILGKLMLERLTVGA